MLEASSAISDTRFRHDVIVVAIPAYNEERHIAETIASVQAQRWTNFVAVISDNASTDRTGEVCRREIAGDPRFHYIRHAENAGASANFNWVLDRSESPLFMWMGAHDLIHPDFLADHVRALEERPDCSLSYSLTQWIDESAAPLKVTDPSALADIRGRPLARYFGSVRRLRECTVINNVLRRSAIGQVRFNDVPGCDMVMISEMLFRGPANRIAKPQYLRREIAHRNIDYMERLTGKTGLSRDYGEMVALYLANFDRLLFRHPMRRLARPLLKSLIERSRQCRPFTSMDWIHIAAMRLLAL